MAARVWTEEDNEFLRNNFLEMSNDELAEHFGVTNKAIQGKMWRMGLKRAETPSGGTEKTPARPKEKKPAQPASPPEDRSAVAEGDQEAGSSETFLDPQASAAAGAPSAAGPAQGGTRGARSVP